MHSPYSWQRIDEAARRSGLQPCFSIAAITCFFTAAPLSHKPKVSSQRKHATLFERECTKEGRQHASFPWP